MSESIEKSLESIRTFVSSIGSTRNDILISGHCSGFRVTLIADGKHISFSTGYDFLSTFEDALKYFDNNLTAQKDAEKKSLRDEKAKLLKEVAIIDAKLKQK